MNSEELSGKKIRVTGATGFIGYRLAEILVKYENAKVTGAGRNLEKASELKDFGVELLALNLTDQNELDEALTDVDYVFNCAGALGGDDKTSQIVNETATRKLVEAAGRNGV